MVGLPIFPEALIVLRIDDAEMLTGAYPQPMAFDAALDNGWASHQNRRHQTFIDGNLYGPQDALALPLCIDDPASVRRDFPRRRKDRLHQGAAVVDELLQALSVGIEVGDWPGGDPRLHRSLRDSWGHLDDE